MKTKLSDEHHIIGFEEDGKVALISTPNKKEDGLMTFNPRNIILRIIFREPEIIKLVYKKRSGK